MINEKTKSLHSISIEGCEINTRLRYSFHTNNITIGVTHRWKRPYYEANKDKINTKGKEWYKINRDYALEYRKQYNDSHRDERKN